MVDIFHFSVHVHLLFILDLTHKNTTRTTPTLVLAVLIINLIGKQENGKKRKRPKRSTCNISPYFFSVIP